MQMMRGRCRSCEWEYDIIALPMPLADAASAMARSFCPMCGGTNNYLTKHARALTEAEREHKQKVTARHAAVTMTAPTDASSAPSA